MPTARKEIASLCEKVVLPEEVGPAMQITRSGCAACLAAMARASSPSLLSSRAFYVSICTSVLVKQ
jgi:hypothetical protein